MVILATTYTLIARSVMVPSSFGRTLSISALAVLPPAYFFLRRGMPFVSGASPGRVQPTSFSRCCGVWSLFSPLG
jgi:hypothetical protein